MNIAARPSHLRPDDHPRQAGRAASGGGIHNAGTLTLTNSTLSGNSADGSGGGIYNLGT